MKTKLLEILVCPQCKNDLALLNSIEVAGDITEGVLRCEKCVREYKIKKGIPRFIEDDNYASSFGYQWNLFRKEQIDSHNGTELSAKRLWAETGWRKDELKGKWLLDAGCGAGRFLDAASHSQAEIVGVDISNAIEAAKENLQGKENVHFVQASIYEMPFKKETFDFCYCIGVVQHTPDPLKTLRSIAHVIKEKGKIAVTIYERKRFTMLYSKYWLRPVTKRLDKKTLLNVIRGAMPILFPLTDVLFRIPLLGKAFMFAIPVANYVDETALSRRQRYDWAILDTFDMLSPQYDLPPSHQEAVDVLSAEGITDLQRLSTGGLNLVGKRGSQNGGSQND